MRRFIPLALVAAALALPVGAQSNGKRANTNLSPNATVETAFATVVAAPQEKVPPASPNLTPPARLVYGAWVETSVANLLEVQVRTSNDGGINWFPPIPVHLGVPNESIETIALAATFNKCYLLVQTNATNTSVFYQDVYAYASSDDGQSWKGPLIVNTSTSTVGDTDLLRAIGVNGNAVVVWEADQQVPTVQGDEDLYRAVVGTDATGVPVFVVNETRVNTLTPLKNTLDIDNPSLAADGLNVVCAYMDEINVNNQTFVVLSNDGGLTWGAPTSISQGGTGSDISSNNACAISGQNVYVVYDLNTNSATSVFADTPVMSFSNDGGTTWTTDVLLSDLPTPIAGIDADAPRVFADGDTVAFLWHDDRLGDSNNGNRSFIVVDRNKGQTLAKGPLPNVPLDFGYSPQTNRIRTENPYATIAGDAITVFLEASQYQSGTALAEDIACATSSDGGLTWPTSLSLVTASGSLASGTTDADIGIVAASAGNGSGGSDHTVSFGWDPNSGGQKEAFVSGGRTPKLEYLGNGFGFRCYDIPKRFDGDSVIVAVTELAWRGGSTASFKFDNTGLWPNFRATPFSYTLYLSFSGLYSSIAANGQAHFPSALSVPTGLAFEAIAIGFGNGRVWYTDPIPYK